MLFETANHRVGDNIECGFFIQATRMSNGQDSFYPSTTFIAVGTVVAFAPYDVEAKHPFRVIVGGRNSAFRKEHKQSVHFLVDAADELGLSQFQCLQS